MRKSKLERRKEILNAGLHEFTSHGIAGARMNAIAQNTGVTKAMIHYYFETKENLFKEVFREASHTVMNGLMEVLEKEAPLFNKIETFIDQLLDRFHQQPDLIRFVSNELNQHKSLTEPIFEDACHYDTAIFEQQLQEAASNYRIAPVEADQLVANILALCMFPYSSRGLLQTLLGMEETNYRNKFLKDRRELIKDTIINGLAG